MNEHIPIGRLMRGGCMAFAIALHDETGFPVMAVTERENIHCGRMGIGSATHWLVRHPDGGLLDAEGYHGDPTQVVEDWAEGEPEEFGLAEAEREQALEWHEEASEQVSLDEARQFARALLRRLEMNPEGTSGP